MKTKIADFLFLAFVAVIIFLATFIILGVLFAEWPWLEIGVVTLVAFCYLASWVGRNMS